ncbi:hemoglobin-like flavoprotein [Pseudomonas sp. JAI115]|nr:hemoglobin-like flavoprotein [Pseudomonas sp. JAI115]
MLSVQDRAIVKSTVPLLESGGEALITHFYRMMLSEYPEVRHCSTRRIRPVAISRARWPMVC